MILFYWYNHTFILLTKLKFQWFYFLPLNLTLFKVNLHVSTNQIPSFQDICMIQLWWVAAKVLNPTHFTKFQQMTEHYIFFVFQGLLGWAENFSNTPFISHIYQRKIILITTSPVKLSCSAVKLLYFKSRICHKFTL